MACRGPHGPTLAPPTVPPAPPRPNELVHYELDAHIVRYRSKTDCAAPDPMAVRAIGMPSAMVGTRSATNSSAAAFSTTCRGRGSVRVGYRVRPRSPFTVMAVTTYPVYVGANAGSVVREDALKDREVVRRVAAAHLHERMLAQPSVGWPERALRDRSAVQHPHLQRVRESGSGARGVCVRNGGASKRTWVSPSGLICSVCSTLQECLSEPR